MDEVPLYMHRGTSLITKHPTIGPYGMPIHRAL